MTFQALVLPAPDMLKEATWQESEASTITVNVQEMFENDFLQSYCNNTQLCCPSLNPQMTGDPMAPGEVMLNVSVVQSPIAPPKK